MTSDANLPSSIGPIPSGAMQHPLVQGRLFYTLHSTLLAHLRQEVGLDKLDPALYADEKALSRASGDHAAQVGFWNASPVRYNLLRDPPESMLQALEAMADEFKDDPAWQEIENPKEQLLAGQRKVDRFRTDTRGYCAWLLTQPTFLAEHDAFFEKWQGHVRQYGLPEPGPLADTARLNGVHQPDEQTQQYCAEFDAFLSRWCLAHLRGPYLPEPQQVQFPVLNAQHAADLLRRGGRLVYMPAIAPIPDRATLRELMEDAQGRPDQPGHLQDWMQIIDAGNSAKGQITRLARVFQLQHFWRVLHHRWGDRLNGCIEKLQYTFAAFLLDGNGNANTTNVETIRKDLQLLSECHGGTNWYRRPCALDHF